MSESTDVKYFVHTCALITASIAMLLLTTGIATAADSATAPAPAPAPAAKSTTTTQQEDDASAAKRRAASSEFERKKLDSDAFEADDKKASGEDTGTSSSNGSFLRFVFGLIVVVGAILGVHWLLKRWGQSRIQGVAGRTGVIDVVATTNLAQGRTLHLVRVGRELVLVGATEQSITRIGEMDAAALGEMAADRGNGEFQAMLNGAMVAGQPGVPAGMGGTSSANDPFLKRFLDNLRMSTAR
jgi:flagellar biogenesis protein FliO